MKFIVHKPLTSNTAPNEGNNNSQNEDISATSEMELTSPTNNTPHSSLQIDHVQHLADSPPKEALRDPEVTKIFAHYIAILAPWYDLNDSSRTFGILVPELAIASPILFKAIIAFAACHWNRVKGTTSEMASVFHASCVVDVLLSISQSEVNPDAELNLIAACLLRSFEILNGGSEMESHLLGAYSYATSIPIDFSEHRLSQAGAWNYLREEITAGLIQRREVRIGEIFVRHDQTDRVADRLSDRISYLLARVINFCFGSAHLSETLQERRAQWQSLNSNLKTWKSDLPPSFEPYSSAIKPDNPFPSIWLHRPWHVAAHQYCALVETMLVLYDPCPRNGHLSHHSLAFAQEQALSICGSAWTNDDEAARVNAFGPLAFCGRYLSLKQHQTALVAFLHQMKAQTGWPVESIIESLQEHWRSMDY